MSRKRRQPEGFGGQAPMPEAAPRIRERPKKNREYLLPLCFFLPGVFCLCLAAFVSHSSYRLLHDGLRAPGTVIDTVISHDSKGGNVSYPVVRYTAQDGRIYQFESSSGSNPPSYDVGDAVEVLYWANDPKHGTIKGFFSLWGGSLIVGFLGFMFSGAGILLFYLIVLLPRRRKHRPDRKRAGSPA